MQIVLDIEPIEKNSRDFEELQNIKAKNNTKYLLNDVKNILGLYNDRKYTKYSKKIKSDL